MSKLPLFEREVDKIVTDNSKVIAALQNTVETRNQTIIEMSQQLNKEQAENAKIKDQLADYESVLRYVKNNKSGHGFRINSVLYKWSDDL
jgi:hypothetical protein